MAEGPQWVIGWREWVALPDLGITRIKAKVDTGARSSALHAERVERFRRHGRSMLRFVVHPLQRTEAGRVHAETEMIDERRVRSSNGREELRPVVRTTVRMRERLWEVELTLTNRDEMGFRLLLGRQALRRHFLIHPGRSFLAGGGPPKPRKSRTHS